VLRSPIDSAVSAGHSDRLSMGIVLLLSAWQPSEQFTQPDGQVFWQHGHKIQQHHILIVRRHFLKRSDEANSEAPAR